MENERNKQLVRIIGRRLIDACTPAVDAELPPSIVRHLASLRESEQRRSAPKSGQHNSSSSSSSSRNGSEDEESLMSR